MTLNRPALARAATACLAGMLLSAAPAQAAASGSAGCVGQTMSTALSNGTSAAAIAHDWKQKADGGEELPPFVRASGPGAYAFLLAHDRFGACGPDLGS